MDLHHIYYRFALLFLTTFASIACYEVFEDLEHLCKYCTILCLALLSLIFSRRNLVQQKHINSQNMKKDRSQEEEKKNEKEKGQRRNLDSKTIELGNTFLQGERKETFKENAYLV